MSRASQEQLADRILLLVRSKPKQKIEISDLSKKFKSEVPEINAALRILDEWGYRFSQNKGKISFVSAPDILSATEISHKLKTTFMGKVIHSFNSVKSTNDIAHQLAEKGAVEGTIVTAESRPWVKDAWDEAGIHPIEWGFMFRLF